jgi:sugar lactone lactonase YvrE
LAADVRVAPATSEQTLLGEGVRWDARREELLHVDILAGRVFRQRPEADGSLSLVRAYALPWTVGALAPVGGDDGWLLAASSTWAPMARRSRSATSRRRPLG